MLLFAKSYNFIYFRIEKSWGSTWKIWGKDLISRWWLSEGFYSKFLLELLWSVFIDSRICLIHFKKQILLFLSFIYFFFIVIVLVGHCPSSKLYWFYITFSWIIFSIFVCSSFYGRKLLYIIEVIFLRRAKSRTVFLNILFQNIFMRLIFCWLL